MGSRKHRTVSSFNLSFLDIMFCGFGAVVMLVLIINSNIKSSREVKHKDLSAEVMRLEKEVKAGELYLAELQNSFDEIEEEFVSAQGKGDIILSQIKQFELELATFHNETLARKKHVNELSSDLKTLDKEHKRLGAEVQKDQEQGSKVLRFVGQDNRQYLTGLKLGGKRVLLLIDASASMLDRTIVNIIRQRNLNKSLRQQTAKWQQVVRTAHWLLANLPAESSVNMYTFNTSAQPVHPDTANRWIPITERTTIEAMLTGLKQVVPEKGTSLVNVFKMAARLKPRPDNIILLTDGLPTQGQKAVSKGVVSGEKRIQLFHEAIRSIPPKIPVNTILYPMEGDPMAASLFWKLAVDSGGSFLTPTRDWP